MAGNYRKNLIIYTLMVILFLFGYNYYYHNINCDIKKNIEVNYAIPTKFLGRSPYASAKVTIFIDNKFYEIESAFFGKEPVLGTKYFILSSSQNMNHSILLSNCPVPDSLEIPKNGWKKMPIPAYQKEVDAYFEENLNSGIYRLFPKCD